MRVAKVYQMQNMDREAIECEGIPSTLLMERAAEGFAKAALEVCVGSAHSPKRAAVFCGPGNNGGDGVAAARLLRKAGMDVRTFLVGKRERMTGDCREMERRLRELGGFLEEVEEDSAEQIAWTTSADVVLDAVFGVGLNREVRGTAAEVISWINKSRGTVISADIASGVSADTGCILGLAVKADVTVTFTCAKPGHLIGKGALHTGKLIVHDIGIPKTVQKKWLDSARTCISFFDAREASEYLPQRPADGHKGTFGKLYVLGGSVGFTGAPVFASRAAVRTGSGLVFVGVPEQVYGIVAGNCEEAMPYPLACDEDGRLNKEACEKIFTRLESCDVGIIGPGMGRSAQLEELVCKLLRETDKPLLVDADGLYALRNHKELLRERWKKGQVTIVTPHDGEFAYLGGMPGETDRQDRLNAAVDFAETYGCILVLKGPGTIVAAPDGRVFINTTGNCGMAKGGSGDVLAGMIASLVGQGMEPARAAALGVWMHGRAGDLCAEALTTYAMRPMDLVEYLPGVFRELVGERKRRHHDFDW